jgi:hypothetical protein
MPQGGRYILCDRCKVSTFSLNLPWPHDGTTMQAAQEAGWKADGNYDLCPSCLEPYAEFDDCVWTGPYCSSKKAMDEMRRLAGEHDLGFLYNPGGGQFTRRGDRFNCQITTCDDVLDLNTLRRALENAGRK